MKYVLAFLTFIGLWTLVSLVFAPIIGRWMKRQHVLAQHYPYSEAELAWLDDSAFDRIVINEGRTPLPEELPSYHYRVAGKKA